MEEYRYGVYVGSGEYGTVLVVAGHGDFYYAVVAEEHGGVNYVLKALAVSEIVEEYGVFNGVMTLIAVVDIEVSLIGADGINVRLHGGRGYDFEVEVDEVAAAILVDGSVAVVASFC
jgi:hypothetical protein